MGQTQNKKGVQQPKPTNCRELVQFIYNYNINFFDDEYLQILQKLPLKYSGLISQLLILKQDQSEVWQKLFKKQIKNLDDQELRQIMSLSIPDTYLKLSESKMDNFYSLFSTYLSNSDLTLESETLNKLSLALYTNYIHETNIYLDQVTNKEEIQFLIQERKCLLPNKRNIQIGNCSKLIKIILLIREMLETDCNLIEYILSSVEEIEFQIYFYQIFWELFTKTLVCLKAYSRFYSDFQQLIDIKYEIDKVQPMKPEVIGACIWGQRFTGWLQRISSEIDGKIKSYRNNGVIMPYYAQLLSSLLDIMGNEITMPWIGHSRVPHTDNVIQFKNLLINNTQDRQNEFPQGDFDQLKVEIENDIQLMKKILPSWLVNQCVIAIHINFLKEFLQEKLANLPDYEITIIINKLQGDFQKVDYEEKDQQKPLPDYIKIRQSHFDLHEIIEELGYNKLDSITKSEYSTVKTTCSQMQQNRIFSILSSQTLSSQQQSIQLQQSNLNSEITQHQSHLTQATQQRKYSNESITEETEIPIYDLVSYYISLVIENQVNIADMDSQIQFKNKGQVIPVQALENQFCTIFKQPIHIKKMQDSVYKMAPCRGSKFLSETLLENM